MCQKRMMDAFALKMNTFHIFNNVSIEDSIHILNIIRDRKLCREHDIVKQKLSSGKNKWKLKGVDMYLHYDHALSISHIGRYM